MWHRRFLGARPGVLDTTYIYWSGLNYVISTLTVTETGKQPRCVQKIFTRQLNEIQWSTVLGDDVLA